MKTKGIDVVGFGAGQPDFDTPKYIKNAAVKALEEGFTNYTPASGMTELKEAVCNKFSRDNCLNYKPEQIVISSGAKHSLYNTFQALLNPGDEVLLPEPYWVSYPEMIKMAEGKPVAVETSEDNDFKMTPEKLKEKINSATKAILVNSPSNPTGCVYTKEELESIANLALKNDIYIVSDEIYEHLIYEDLNHFSIAALSPEVKERTIVINGMSKAYAMTGWRIGFTAAETEIIEIISNIQSHSTSNPNSIAQYASVTGLNETEKAEKYITKMKGAFDRRRNYMYNKINSIPGLSSLKPRGAFYTMLNIGEVLGNEIQGSLAFADQLLEKEKVAVVPGIAFGTDSYVRLSYANSMESIKKGLNRIESFVTSL